MSIVLHQNKIPTIAPTDPTISVRMTLAAADHNVNSATSPDTKPSIGARERIRLIITLHASHIHANLNLDRPTLLTSIHLKLLILTGTLIQGPLTILHQTFKNFTLYQGNDKLQVGNGTNLSTSPIGSCSLHFISLSTVLVVPHITKPVHSVSKITTENEVYFEFWRNRCFIKSLQGKILLQGNVKNGLYHLPHSLNKLPIASSPYMALTRVHSTLHGWHKRHGSKIHFMLIRGHGLLSPTIDGFVPELVAELTLWSAATKVILTRIAG
ncbi:hypothetical protein LXL04_000217 [Taraxacum kok-saghyz]